MEILQDKISLGLLLCQKISCDNRSNLQCEAIRTKLKGYSYIFDTSPAYHASGNLLSETAVKRAKHAIGNKSIEDSRRNLMALNTAEPYDCNQLTSFESLYGLMSPVSRIPMNSEKIKWVKWKETGFIKSSEIPRKD